MEVEAAAEREIYGALAEAVVAVDQDLVAEAEAAVEQEVQEVHEDLEDKYIGSKNKLV
ncbi:hypothetical protein [Neobacillus fumarioli]|uniref:hypothetical protein n=1 Tax=Neobacillus fumarioli TaxID=105229 RepID=UPI000B011AB8|nr:hypothetical protein [Neobacillus fumarioli]